MALTFTDEELVRKIVKEEVHEEVKSQLTDFRSEIISHLDAILKVTTDTQQELVALSHTSTNHEDRIVVIEDKLDISY